MRTTGKNKSLKLIAACSVAIFSLGSICAGAYAWFTLEMKQALGPTDFAVVNVGTCNLYSMELVKFNYYVHQYGGQEIVDYSTPETGTVKRYQYSNEYNSFGENESGTWHPVSVMNLYDPVSLTLSGGQLSSLNCNSIYKFTISSIDLTEAKLDSYVRKILSIEKTENEIFLTTCTDFDIYFEEDLLDTNPAFGDDHKAYYPDYIEKTEDITDDEELYYKVSYLSSLATSHANLYDGDGSIATEIPVEFSYDSTSEMNFLTLYINVNYAPSQLEDTMHHIYKNNINAICDFGFYFYFLQEDDE